jgi:GR25 family glycosyltransferase involved in LPS biosynthesis
MCGAEKKERAAMAIPTYVAHLSGDADREANIRKIASDNPILDVTIIPGVLGADLPRVICAAIADDQGWADQRGEIGCFLSHIKCWEKVAQSSADYCLILEDDVTCEKVERFNALSIPAGVDILFVNDRMASMASASDSDAIPSCVSVLDGLDRFTRSGRLIQRDIGADGYALSPRGAEILLRAVAADLCFGHVDWRLLRYCVTEHEVIRRFGLESELTHVLRRHHNPKRPPAWGVLSGRCLSAPLIRHENVFASTRARVSEGR